jgi:hypothetical protein
MHDTIGCYLDIDKGHVKFSKNGKLSGSYQQKQICDLFLHSLILFSPLPYPAAFHFTGSLLWICSVSCTLLEKME